MDFSSERLTKLRQNKNITMSKLASDIGVSRSLISKYEKGERAPGREIIALLANYFNVSVDYLFGRDELTEPASEQAKKLANDSELLELAKNKLEILNLLDRVPAENREVVDRTIKALIQSIIDSQE